MKLINTLQCRCCEIEAEVVELATATFYLKPDSLFDEYWLTLKWSFFHHRLQNGSPDHDVLKIEASYSLFNLLHLFLTFFMKSETKIISIKLKGNYYQ